MSSLDLDIPNCPTNPVISEGVVIDNNDELNRINDDGFISVLSLPRCLKRSDTLICGNLVDFSETGLQLSLLDFTIPSITIPSQEKVFSGATRKESSGTISQFEDITVKFKLDNKLDNYHILYSWLQMLRNVEDGKAGGFSKTEYQTTFNVLLQDEYKKIIGMYTFDGVFPVSLGGIALNFSTAESIFIDFTFSFDFISFEKNPKY